MLKTRIFEEKTVIISSASKAPPPNPRLPLAGFKIFKLGSTPRSPCCYFHLQLRFVEFVSSGKYVLLPSKRNKITTVNVLLLLLLHFAPIFHLKLK